jgi:hypothetical protein
MGCKILMLKLVKLRSIPVLSRFYRITNTLSAAARDYSWFLVGAMAILMFALGIMSMKSESAIVDELAHIPAAYSYDHYGDYRLNPEHPPLLKNLAGLPLQFMSLKFPVDEPSWATDVNGQWEAGWNFIYHLGNNANQILFWARLPILLMAVGFTFILYRYVRYHWGIAAGLLVTFFYTLSPNIIAHARYVTTDVGASVFIFIAIAVFLRFIHSSTSRNLIWLSLALAAANLVKFNSVILYPFLLVIAILAAWANLGHNDRTRFRLYVGGLISASALSLIWIYLYYLPNVMNMPGPVQEKLVRGSLVYGPGLKAADILSQMSHYAVLRPFVQYVLGILMVFGRIQGGNITYFNENIKNGSYHLYFFELFALKTQIAFLILMTISLAVGLGALWFGRKSISAFLMRWKGSLRTHLAEWTFGLFAIFYFLIAVTGNLNLGIRHILPIYLPLFFVVGISIVRVMRGLLKTSWRPWSQLLFGALVIWYGLSTILAYPSYTAYFNEFIGGGGNADNYFSDSGVDWGQDLIHLHDYVKANHIDTLALDYFGGGEPRYYFCDRKYDASGYIVGTSDGYNCTHSGLVLWHSSYGEYTGQYIAVSETYLENDRYYAAVSHQPGYGYLRAMKPVAKIGNSIYVYKLH